ncbi:hypothetical protein GCK32_022646 [Trichostrongylus colubriformis]|uniref:Uncharacterized protein n=1 Tax=Trichostrongylus colubriformis TaxID=6319 RepID=A0AAN8IXH1_TRICO
MYNKCVLSSCYGEFRSARWLTRAQRGYVEICRLFSFMSHVLDVICILFDYSDIY